MTERLRSEFIPAACPVAADLVRSRGTIAPLVDGRRIRERGQKFPLENIAGFREPRDLVLDERGLAESFFQSRICYEAFETSQ